MFLGTRLAYATAPEISETTNYVVATYPIEIPKIVRPSAILSVLGPSQKDNWYLGHDLAIEYGLENQWTCIENVIFNESGWKETALNPSSGACGLGQSLPCNKMRTHGEDYRTNPETQLRWTYDYMLERYGSPCGAWKFWQLHKWY